MLCPGHGPFVWQPYVKLDEKLEHRLKSGGSSRRSGTGVADDLRAARRAGPEVPQHLRGAPALTLEAHLEKQGEDGRRREESGLQSPSRAMFPQGLCTVRLRKWLSITRAAASRHGGCAMRALTHRSGPAQARLIRTGMRASTTDLDPVRPNEPRLRRGIVAALATMVLLCLPASALAFEQR